MSERPRVSERDIAIVGLSCLFPGAPDVDAYWRNILGKVDAALQVQVLWARRHWDVTLLPTFVAGVRLRRPLRAGRPLRHCLRVRPGSRAPIAVADHWLYDGDELVATLTGVEGVGTRALNRLGAGA